MSWLRCSLVVNGISNPRVTTGRCFGRREGACVRTCKAVVSRCDSRGGGASVSIMAARLLATCMIVSPFNANMRFATGFLLHFSHLNKLITPDKHDENLLNYAVLYLASEYSISMWTRSHIFDCQLFLLQAWYSEAGVLADKWFHVQVLNHRNHS